MGESRRGQRIFRGRGERASSQPTRPVPGPSSISPMADAYFEMRMAYLREIMPIKIRYNHVPVISQVGKI